jgi:hypothetical protein
VDENPPEGTSERNDYGEGDYQEAVVTPSRPDDPNIPGNIGSGPAHVDRSCFHGTCTERIWDPKAKTSGEGQISIDSTGMSCSDLNKRAQEELNNERFGTGGDVTVSFGWPTIWYVKPSDLDFTKELGL